MNNMSYACFLSSLKDEFCFTRFLMGIRERGHLVEEQGRATSDCFCDCIFIIKSAGEEYGTGFLECDSAGFERVPDEGVDGPVGGEEVVDYGLALGAGCADYEGGFGGHGECVVFGSGWCGR